MKTLYIGSGPISNFHLPAALNNGFVIDKITSTPDSERCKKICEKFNLMDAYSPKGWMHELEDCHEFDCIIICVDTKVTPQILAKASKTGKPILVEKPVAWHHKFLDSIDNKDKIIVAYNRRFYQTVSKLKKFVENTHSGILYINIPDSPSTIRQYLVNSCHLVDLARYIVGDISIDHSSVISNDDNGVAGLASIGHSNSNNWVVLFQCSWSTPDNFSIKASSSGYTYELRPIECLSIYNKMAIQEPSAEIPIRIYTPEKDCLIYETARFKPGFESQYQSFYKFVDTGYMSEGMCNLEDSMLSLNLCHEMIKSLKLEPTHFIDF